MLSERKYNRIVIKIGSSLFYSGKELRLRNISGIISAISVLKSIHKKEVVIVSSGAIALGMDLLNFKSRPKDLPGLQSAAAIGQNKLMDSYSGFFKEFAIECAQVLLTSDDLSDRQRYLNAKNTLFKLLEFGVVPIINENDTISTDEIKFGDNDQLSARVAGLIKADLLIILSDVEGLLDKRKKVIRVIDEITSEVESFACPTDKKTCVGGMITKIKAAKIAVKSGIPCVIANGRTRDIVGQVISGPEKSGTLFVPKKGLSAREHWIAFGSKPKGKIIVDDGAKRALLNKKSLLAVGVNSIIGDFSSGSTVSVADLEKRDFAKGKVRVSGKKLEEIKGKHFDREIIHRNDIVIL